MGWFSRLLDRLLRHLSGPSIELWRPPPVPTPDQIADAQSRLGIRFPGSYLIFLRAGRPMTLSDCAGFHWPGDASLGSRHIVEANRWLHKECGSPSPEYLVTFYNDGFGNEVCFDTRKPGPDGEYPIVFWDHELGAQGNLEHCEKPAASSVNAGVIASGFTDWFNRLQTEIKAWIAIRLERPDDHGDVRALNRRAFKGGVEAGLVDALRGVPGALSLVAEEDGRVVGHILYTPVTIEGGGRTVAGAALAPMAVLPKWQRRGIGSRLVREGLEILRGRGCPFVIVLGHPEYYPRFGFEAAAKHGIRCTWEGIPPEALMIAVSVPGVLPPGGGLARYRPEFDAAV
jgi:putative acetyltransferase